MPVTAFRLILFCLSIVSAAELFAQTGDKRTSQRDSMQQLALQTERRYFEATTAQQKATALLQKAQILKNENQFNAAFQNLKRSDTLVVNDSLFYRLRYETALCAYLSNNFNEAEYQLLQINMLRDTAWRDSCLLLTVLVQLELEKWPESKAGIIRYARQKNIFIDTTDFFSTAKKLGLKSKTKAQRMSMIVPGLGQVYAGKPWRGITSFLLVGGSLTYGVFTFIDGYYISSVLTGTGMAWRFYTGGIRYSGQLVETHNDKRKRAYIDHTKKVLLGKRIYN